MGRVRGVWERCDKCGRGLTSVGWGCTSILRLRGLQFSRHCSHFSFYTSVLHVGAHPWLHQVRGLHRAHPHRVVWIVRHACVDFHDISPCIDPHPLIHPPPSIHTITLQVLLGAPGEGPRGASDRGQAGGRPTEGARRRIGLSRVLPLIPVRAGGGSRSSSVSGPDRQYLDPELYFL